MTTLLQQSLVFFGSAVILVPILHKLGLGSVIGYLLAGILVGPFGLRFIQEAESVIHFAELGVVLLLFLIGLEIQPRKLWSMRRHVFGLGGTQVFACCMVFTVAGVASGLSLTNAAVIGFALSLSSTAFAMQTLTEKNQLNTEFGRSSFSILLMQDLMAIPALAIIPLLAARSSSEPPSLKQIAIIALVGIVVLVSSRFLIRPIFQFIARTGARDIFTAAALLLVLGVAALMQKIGLSAALGTFIAGVMLADSEYRHEIEADLEPFKGLLMGLFFIGIGMSVDVGYVAGQPFTVLSLAIAYLAVKISLIYASGRLFNINHENSKRMALTISQGGEFAFVIFTIALQSQLAPSPILTLWTAIITLSMAGTPLLILADDRLMQWKRAKTEPEYDEIKDETPDVIIAGFGRFGQIFGRLLRAQGIAFVAIDHDPDQIELVRRFGNKVYYGNAARRDLLERAGIATAKYVVLAIDDMEESLRAAGVITTSYPHIKIFARARNRGHAFELMERGIKFVKREVFDSSVEFCRELLIEMGYTEENASRMIERFRRHDELMLLEQFKVRKDDKMFVSISKQATEQLAQVLNEDLTKTYVDAPADVRA